MPGVCLAANGAVATAGSAPADNAADAAAARTVRRVTIGTLLSRQPSGLRHHLQCFTWHCWLHAAGFFMAKFLAHQLLQNATHRDEAAAAFVPVTGASIAAIMTTVVIRARTHFIGSIHFRPPQSAHKIYGSPARRTVIDHDRNIKNRYCCLAG